MKRKKSLKRICLASAGLLTASTASAFTESTIISAQNKTQDSVLESTNQTETEEVLLSTEVTTEYENFEESSTVESETETTESSDSQESTSSEETTETNTSESSTEESSTEDSSTTDSSSTEESSTTEDSSTTDSSSSSSTTDSSTSTSSSGGSTGTTTSSSKPNKPSKPGTSTSKPNKPSVSTGGSRPGSSISGNTTSSTVVGPTQPTYQYNQTSGTSNTNYGISTAVYYIPRNLTTQAFINEIGEDAREIAGKNNLYASVMIAQAILESGSGNSALASAPNYNLFGIKGSYEGSSVNFLTQEDTGGGQMISIRAGFRKYPSYKESLTDYMKLLSNGVSGNKNFYSGTWKNKTDGYQDATKYLTGRYATDTSYASKLNSLIKAYELDQYDELNAEKETLSSISKKVTDKVKKDIDLTKDEEKKEQLDILYHVVKKGESLKSISELYNIPVSAILERNQFERRMIFVGQKLIIPTTDVEKETTVVQKEEIVDRSIRSVQRVIRSIQGEEKNSNKSYNLTASKKKSTSVYEVQSGDTLAKISKKTGISILSLKEWNNLDQYFLTEGQELVLTPPYTTSI
ncbi:glucosaminidase domain-containing protein [Enterococcus sp. LJL51]|uniref:glucosaminidase domain-containing protein n=1 Tax=Enterococcus sp. LJL51 TaxID=3416656 RepID=UPI003CE78C65